MTQRNIILLISFLIITFSSVACRQAAAIGEGVVTSERVQLKQSTARVPGYAGELKRGDKVTIIGEQDTFIKVRSDQPKQIEGWLEKREIVSQDLYAKAKAEEQGVSDLLKVPCDCLLPQRRPSEIAFFRFQRLRFPAESIALQRDKQSDSLPPSESR